MAVTEAEAKLRLSINMVDKTMTVYVLASLAATIAEAGGTYLLAGYNLVDPLGDVYPITGITTDSYSQEVDCPTDSSGNVIEGSYRIIGGYQYIDIPADDTYQFSYNDSSYTLSYTTPTVCLSGAINCISPSFVSTDYTDYRVIDPTSQGYITPTTVTYAHNLYYPATSNGYPSNATLTSDLIITRGASEFYQGTQTAIVTHLVSYLFVDGLVVTDTIEGSLETKVDCATLTCTLTCGLNNAGTAMFAEQGENEGEFQKKQQNLILATTYTSLVQFNINCGDSDMATFWMTKAKSLLGSCCTGCTDCGAADGTPISGYGN